MNYQDNYVGTKSMDTQLSQHGAKTAMANAMPKQPSVTDMASSLNEESMKMFSFASQLRDRLIGPTPEDGGPATAYQPDLKGHIRNTGNNISSTNVILQEIYNYLIG